MSSPPALKEKGTLDPPLEGTRVTFVDRYVNNHVNRTLSIEEYFLDTNRYLQVGESTCNVILEYTNGRYDCRPYRPCHGVMSVITGTNGWHGSPVYAAEDLVGVWTSLALGRSNTTINREQAESYWDYVLDPEASPYRKLLEGVSVLRNSAGIYYACRLNVTSDTPSNSFVNLLQALRVTIEHPSSVLLFHKALDAGFEKDEAFAIMTLGGDVRGSVVAIHHAHFPWPCGNVIWERIRDGDPYDAPKATLRTTRYSGVFGCFNASPTNGPCTVIHESYLSCGNDKNYTGAFKKLLVKVGHLTHHGAFPGAAFSVSDSLSGMMASRSKLFPRGGTLTKKKNKKKEVEVTQTWLQP